MGFSWAFAVSFREGSCILLVPVPIVPMLQEIRLKESRK